MILILGKGTLGRQLFSELYKESSTFACDSKDVDLTDWNETKALFKLTKPKEVWMCAGMVGGVEFNSYHSLNILFSNSNMAMNTIRAAGEYGVKNFYYIGSSCMYPITCKQPMREEDLGTGKLEKTNHGYATAKLLGYELCKTIYEQENLNYKTFVPCNLVDPWEKTDHRAHFVGAIVSKYVDAVQKNESLVRLLGTGNEKRELITSKDCAKAMILMKNYNSPVINIGSGKEYTIREIADYIKDKVGFKGNTIWSETLGGVQRKIVDSTLLKNSGFIPEDIFPVIDQLIENYSC